MSLYSGVLKSKPANLIHTVAAANNVIVLNRDKDIFDSKKKMKLLANESGLKKLNANQTVTVLYNRCLFALQTNQLEICQHLLLQLKKQFPKHELSVLAESSLLLRKKKVIESVAVLEQYIRSHPSASVSLYLSLAQLHVMSGNPVKVRELLQNFARLPEYVGLVSALVCQYAAAGNVDSALQLLDQTCQWWMKKDTTKQGADRKMKDDILWGSAQFMMQHGRPESAVQLFETLVKQDSTNVRYLSALIAAYAKFAPQKAEELVQSLPQSPVTMSVDIDTLEQMPSFKHSRRQAAKAEIVTTTVKAAAASKTAKKKKKRKPKYPKHYDPASKPDPERWLPLRERSYYRRGKKKGQSSIGRGSQGASAATVGLTAQLDASIPKPSSAESKPSELSSPRAKPQQPQKKQQAKKKKKGRR